MPQLTSRTMWFLTNTFTYSHNGGYFLEATALRAPAPPTNFPTSPHKSAPKG